MSAWRSLSVCKSFGSEDPWCHYCNLLCKECYLREEQPVVLDGPLSME